MTATAATTGEQQRPAAAHNSRTICANWGYVRSLAEGRRAIGVQSVGGDQRSGRTSVVIVALVVALGLDVEVERIRDPLLSAARLMLMISAARPLSCPIRVIRPLKAAPLFAASWLPVGRRS